MSQRFSGQLWPRSPDDLLPYGEDASFSAPLRWFTILDRSAVSGALLYIMLLCRPKLHTLLLLDMNRRLFVRALCAHMASAAQALCRKAEAAGLDALNEIDGPAVRIAALGHLFEILACDMRATFGSDLARGMEDEVMDCLHAAWAIMPYEAEKTRLAELAIMAYESRGTHPAPLPIGLQQYFVRQYTQIGGTQKLLRDILTGVRSRRTCAAPGCGREERGNDTRLNRCASCALLLEGVPKATLEGGQETTQGCVRRTHSALSAAARPRR